MKKIEIKGKLSLNKSTIANLNNEQMSVVKGGADVAANDISKRLCIPSYKKCDTVATI